MSRTTLALVSILLATAVAIGLLRLRASGPDTEPAASPRRPESGESRPGPPAAPAPDPDALPLPADAPAPDPTDAAFVEAYGEPTLELVRRSIERTLEEVFVDHRLSPRELELAAEALFRLREVRRELAALPMDSEHAEQRRTLVEALGLASQAFSDVMDMSPDTFTAAAADAMEVGTGGGIDRDDDPGYVPDDDYLPPRVELREEPRGGP